MRAVVFSQYPFKRNLFIGPVSGPVAKIILLAGSNGSISGSISCVRKYEARLRWIHIVCYYDDYADVKVEELMSTLCE